MEGIPQHSETANKSSLGKLVMISIFIMFVMLILFFVFQRDVYRSITGIKNPQTNSTGQNTTGTVQITPQTTIIPALSYYKLIPPGTASVNNPVDIIIAADSNNKAISGYDILLNYDPQSFSFLKEESLSPNFDIYKNEKTGTISLTGIKKLQNKSDVVFSNTQLVKLSFRPLKVGTFNFTILQTSGPEQSQLVDKDTKRMPASEEQITVTVN